MSTESRICYRFEYLRANGSGKAFVPYLTAGDPDIETTRALARMLERRGADVLELGVPFTDPIADGPVNQRAAQRALERGVRPADVLALVRELRGAGFGLPIVLFTYSNPLLRLLGEAGEAGYARALLGVDGVLVTDLPPEEADPHVRACRGAGIDTIFLASPTTPEPRIPALVAASSGFLYYVSSAGVTGARSELPSDLEGQIARIRPHSAARQLPLCVGFGIASREVAARVCSVADGFVVGSALSAVIERAVAEGRDPVGAAEAFVEAVDPR
jgi:tryptophan synthase alpha chain